MHVARALGVRAAETPPRRDGPRTAVRGGRRVWRLARYARLYAYAASHKVTQPSLEKFDTV